MSIFPLHSSTDKYFIIEFSWFIMILIAVVCVLFVFYKCEFIACLRGVKKYKKRYVTYLIKYTLRQFNKINKEKKRDFIVFASCTLGIIMIWSYSSIYYTNKKVHISSSKVEENSNTDKNKIEFNDNEIGDAMGMINALFSGLGLAGIVLAIILQMKELKETRAELEGQKKELANQNQTSTLARFENSFFNLLEAQRVIGNKVRYKSNSSDENKFSPSGKNTSPPAISPFQSLYVAISKKCAENTFDNFKSDGYSKETAIKVLNHYWKDLSKCVNDACSNGEFDSYFRMTYRILRFIDEYKFNSSPDRAIEDTKDYYASILRSQLSAYELVVIFYNSLIPEYADAKKLYEKYRMFNSLRMKLLYTPFDIFFYNANAFKESHQSMLSAKPQPYESDIERFYKSILVKNSELADMNDEEFLCIHEIKRIAASLRSINSSWFVGFYKIWLKDFSKISLDIFHDDQLSPKLPGI